MNAWETDEYRAEGQRRREAIRARFPGLAEVAFECLPGWYGILERYFEAVRAAVPGGMEKAWSLRQVKEKFGGLRIYADFGFAAQPKLAREVVEPIRVSISCAYYLAECRADRTCEVCGQPGRPLIRGGASSWHMTRCRDPADGGVPVGSWRAVKRRIGDSALEYDEQLDDLVETPRRTVSGMLEAEAAKRGETIERAVLGPLNGVTDADGWPGWYDPVPRDVRGIRASGD